MNRKKWFWFFKTLGQYRRQIIFLLLSAIILGAAGAVWPILLQILVDDAVNHQLSNWLLFLFVVIVFISKAPLSFIQREKLRNKYTYWLRGSLLRHLLRMDMSFHDNEGSTKLTTQLYKGLEGSGNIIEIFGHAQFVVELPVAFFAVWYISSYSPLAAFILVSSFVLSFLLASRAVGKKIIDSEDKYHNIDNNLTHRHREVFEQISTIKTHRAQNTEMVHYWKKGSLALKLRDKLTYMYSLFWFLSDSATGFGYIISVVFFLPWVQDGSITPGTFFALALYAGKTLGPASFLGDFYALFKRSSAMLSPVVDILEVEPKVIENKNAIDIPPIQSEIVVENLSFYYPGSKTKSLDGINLRFPAKTKTAIVGPTGSGKTTLSMLITRLYDPDEGSVEFDGCDLRKASFDSLYSQIAYFSQEIPIFTGTIEDNVSFGLENYSKKDVEYALRMSMSDFVESKDGGIDSKIGELGKKLSGGERQRLALARIFMRKPSVVILDEATSALDNVTESKVHSVFEKLAKMDGGKTMIIIAHRLPTVKSADQIVVMDQGKIVDIGKHEELLKRCELYNNLNNAFEE